VALGAAPGGLPPIGAQAVLLGMQQFNQSVRQVSTGLGQINGASVALERNSVLAATRMTTAFASLTSAYATGGARMVATLGLASGSILGLGAAVVAAGGMAVTSAASFQKAMTPVQVFGDLSKKQTDQLSDSVLQMSRTWGVAANSISAGETALVKAGASFDDLNGPLAQAVTLLNVASEGELSMAESADIVTQGLRSWKLPTSEAINFVNALVGATNASTAGFRGMVQGLGQSQAMAAAAGTSYRDLFAILGELNDENIRGERAGTAYRNLLLRMLSPTKDVAGVMLRYNLSLSDANGNMIQAREFVERLSNAFSDQATQARGLTKAQVDSDLATLGMSRSLLGALAIANQGTEAFDKYQRAIDKTDVTKIAQAFTASTIRQSEIFFRNINAIAIAFGGPFNESLGRAIAGMNKWLQSVNLAQVRAIATIIRDQLGGAINYVASLVSKGAGTLSSMLGGSDVGRAASNAVLGTVTSIIVKVQQVQAIWAAVWNNPNITSGVGSLLNTLARLADAVLPRVQLAMATIGEILVYVIPRALAAIPWDSIATAAETAVSETIKFLDGGYKQVAQNIYDTVLGVVNGVIDAVGGAITAVSTAANGVLTAITDTVKSIVNAILNTLGAIVSGTANFLDPFAANFADLLQFVLEAVQRVVRSIGRAFEPLVTYMTSDVPQSFKPLLDAFKVMIAVGIVVERTFGTLVKNIIQYSYEGWRKAIPLSVDDALSALWKFVRQTGGTIQAAISIIETLADSAHNFFEAWRQVWRGAALTIADFTQGLVSNFVAVFQWLEQQPIIGSFFKDLHEQFDSTKSYIDTLFSDIASAPTDAFTHAKNTIDKIMSGIDMTVQDVRGQVDAAIDAVGSTISGLGTDMQQAFDDAKAVVEGILPTLTNAGEGVKKFLETMIDSARARINSATPEAQKFLDTIKGILAGISNIPAGGITGAVAPSRLPGSNAPETEGVGFPVDQAKAMQQFVARLLHDIPAVTDEFTEFVAKLIEADPNRLNGIVAALNSQKSLLRDIGNLRLEILQTDIKIAEVDQRLNEIHLQQQRIQIQMQQASLPFEQQLLTLRVRSLQIEQQMLPLQNAIADIDKQIALLQRENLSLRMRELQIRSAMMPIENRIADIDKAIAETQKENYAWSIRVAQIQLQMLPVQNAIEDIEKQIARNNQENYALTRQRLLLEQAELPAKNAIEDIDRAIAALQRENYDLIDQQLQIQQQMLPLREQISAIDAEIARTAETNFGIARQVAELDQKALPYKQQIARLEQQITDIVDKRAQLERDRASLIAEHDLKSTERSIKQIDAQLDDLWAKFGTTKGPTRSSLIPQILDLEKQKQQLEDSLKPAQALVDTLKDQQDEIDYNNNLTKIGLQLQQAEQEALLAPINAQIEALKQQQEQEQTLAAVTKARLEEQKAALEAALLPLERQLQVLQEQQERERLRSEAVINDLNREKQLWQDILDSQEAQVLAIKRIEEAQKAAVEIANTYLQEQEQNLKRILESYDNELTIIQRQQQAYSLRNEIVRLGLEQEKARLEAILRTWQDQLTAVERERAAEELRNQIAITSLEQQKRNLENLLAPLEAARTAIERQTASITAQQQLALAAYQAQLLALQRSELENEAYKNQLETLRAQEQARLSALIQAFQNALINSGAFTSAEAAEAVKRLGLWQGEVDKVGELKLSYANLQNQLNNTQPFFNTQNAINNLNSVLPGANSNFSTMAANAAASQAAAAQLNNTLNSLNPNMSTAGSTTYTLASQLEVMRNALAGNPTLEALYTGLTNSFINGRGAWSDNVTIVSGLVSQFESLRSAILNASNAMGTWTTARIKSLTVELQAQQYATYLAKIIPFGDAPSMRNFFNILSSYIGAISSYDVGGFVNGAPGAPQMAVIHGGEYVVSRPEQRQLTAAITRAMTTYNQQQTTVNYNFSASYERQQDPITASMDMRALIEMTR
jgi:TP901 family phage tail tape measure protein